jgi:peptidoglycan/LPS O-acetylase OafA/YrhL
MHSLLDVVSPIPALVLLLIAVATCFILMRQFGGNPVQGRFASIDGLRGYLAFFVFLHHSCIWYFYLRTGHWKVPPSNLYTHFGQSSVALFFMITGFLFFSKLIDGRNKIIDWEKLYISRFLRLVPLYFFVIFLLFITVYYLTNGVLNVSIRSLARETISWLGFTILGAPSLNGFEHTPIVVAGVTWSLPYEWFFYFSLPLLALTVGVIPPFLYIALGIISVICLTKWGPDLQILQSFLGGITASFLVRLEWFRRYSANTISSFIAIACLSSVVALFPTAFEVTPILLLTLAFSLIAAGNSMFGILEHAVSRTLGEMAYSIYLLHGITLFITFNFIIGTSKSSEFSPTEHWLLIMGITPILILTSFATFRFIEHPAMKNTKILTNWLHKFYRDNNPTD